MHFMPIIFSVFYHKQSKNNFLVFSSNILKIQYKLLFQTKEKEKKRKHVFLFGLFGEKLVKDIKKGRKEKFSKINIINRS